MDTNKIASDPAYFERCAADVDASGWREYQPLVYEVRMLAELTRLIRALPADDRPSASQQAANSALIESFAVHFRNLADFLWPPKNPKWGTDVAVGQFVPGWAPSQARPVDLIDRVGQEIAHLTTYRLSGPDPRKRWDDKECIHALRPLTDFVRQSEAAETCPEGLAEAVTSLMGLVDSSNSARYFDGRVNSTTHISPQGYRP